MMHSKNSMNRSKLVDGPIVEMLLSNKYFKSGITFIKSSHKEDASIADMVYYIDGIKRSVIIKRNSSKYFNSQNFILHLDKNKLNVFHNTSYVFIDEVANSLYVVDGIKLLKYILDHQSNLKDYNESPNKAYMVLPKKDIRSIIEENPNSIIKYGNNIATLLELGRDENKFNNLV